MNNFQSKYCIKVYGLEKITLNEKIKHIIIYMEYIHGINNEDRELQQYFQSLKYREGNYIRDKEKDNDQ